MTFWCWGLPFVRNRRELSSSPAESTPPVCWTSTYCPAIGRRALARALLAAVEAQLVQRGIAHLQAVYRPDEHTPIFERLLAAQSWATPVLRSNLFWTRCAVAFGPWVNRYRFRPPYELFPWPELTGDERKRLSARGEAGWYPALVSRIIRHLRTHPERLKNCPILR